jgi:hypothetical protein
MAASVDIQEFLVEEPEFFGDIQHSRLEGRFIGINQVGDPRCPDPSELTPDLVHCGCECKWLTNSPSARSWNTSGLRH